MRRGSEPTCWVRIYMSGPLEIAAQALRQDCLREGLCVTLDATRFIYTGGEETGFVVGLVNYPRFPSDPAAIMDRARHLVRVLMDATCQHSALVMAPDVTEWVTVREEGK